MELYPVANRGLESQRLAYPTNTPTLAPVANRNERREEEPRSNTSNAVAGAIVSGGLGLVGDAIGAFMSWKGMKEQRKENRRADRLKMKVRGEDIMRSERHRRQDIRLRKEERAEDRAEREQLRQDKLNMEKYNRAIGLINNINSIMNRQPKLAANLIAMHKGRA